MNTPYTQEQIETWRKKAEKYEELSNEIFAFYTDDNGEYDAEKEGDLYEIGEACARHFGWL